MTVDSMPDWDSLSDAPPSAQQPSTMDSQANQQITGGADSDQVEADLINKVQSTQNNTFGKNSTKISKVNSSTPDWDSLSSVQPHTSELYSPYQPPQDYQGQVKLSPVSRTTPSDLQKQALAADAAAEPPQDTRREVGFWEAAKRFADARATDASGVIAGAATFLGYPINALDAAISGRPIPSVAEAVSEAEEPYTQRASSEQIQPTEKLGLAGQLGAGVGQMAVDLPTMALSGGGVVAKEAGEGFVGLAQSVANRVLQSAKISSVPAALNAKNAAQQTLESGGSATDAANAALAAANRTVLTNAVPMAVAGNLATRVASGAVIGGALSGSSDPTQIEAGAITGAFMGGAYGERPQIISASEHAAANVKQLSDQIIASNPTPDEALNMGANIAEDHINANQVQADQRGVSEARPEPQGDREGGEDIQQPAEANNERKQVNVDQDVQPSASDTIAQPEKETENIYGRQEEGEKSQVAEPETTTKSNETPDLKENTKYSREANNLLGPLSDDTISSSEEARQILTKEFGKIAVNKLERNGLNFLSKDDISPYTQDLTDVQRDGVKGWTPPDRSSANVVHDNNTEEELPGTVVHEVVHANLDRILPDQMRNNLANAIIQKAKSSPEIQESLDKIPLTTPKGNYKEEVLAQTMGDLYSQPVGRKVMDAFKLGLNRVGVPLNWINGHEAAIRQIGIENLRHYAESAPHEQGQTSYQIASSQQVNNEKSTNQQDQSVKPRIRVPVDQVPFNRLVERDELPSTTTAEREARGLGPVEHVNVADELPSTTTSLKNAHTTAEREARGLGPVEHVNVASAEAKSAESTSRFSDDPFHGDKLRAEFEANPKKNPNAQELMDLLHDRQNLGIERRKAITAIDEATQSGDHAKVAAGISWLEQVEAKLDQSERIGKQTGAEWADAGRARQQLLNEDYSLAHVITRARVARGQKIPDQIRAKLEDLTSKFETAQKALEQSQASEASAKEALEKAQVARGGRARRASAGDKMSISDEFSKLQAELARISKKPEATTEPATTYARAEPQVASIIRHMANNRARAGLEGDDIINQVHAAVKDYVDVSPRDVRDAISGYGNERKPTKNELNIRLNAIKKELRDISRKEDIASGKLDPNATKNKIRQVQLQKELSILNRKLQTGDYSNPVRVKPAYNEKTVKLQANVERVRDQIEKAIRAQRLANRSSGQKIKDTAFAIRRASLLGHVATLAKLSTLAAERMVHAPIIEAINSGLKHIPGISAIAKQSPRYHEGMTWQAEKDAITHTFGHGGFKEVWQVLKTGDSDRDMLYGKGHEYNDSIFNVVSQMHAALHAPTARNEFYRALPHVSNFERNRVIALGMTPDQADAHMAKESTQAMIGGRAYASSMNAVLMHDNALSKWVRSSIDTAYKKGGWKGKIAGAFAEYEFPITKVAFNFAQEVGEHAFGLVNAAGQLIHSRSEAYSKVRNAMNDVERAKAKEAAKNWARNLDPDAADYIMRNLSRQTLGLALIALAYANNQSIGGYYQPGDNKRKGKVEAGSLRIGNVEIPHTVLDNPALEMLQIGSTIRQIEDRERGKSRSDSSITPLLQGILGASVGVYSKLPLVQAPANIVRAISNGGKDIAGFIGNEVRSNIPAPIQDIAKYTDSAEKRKPKGLLQNVYMGIPGLRETVPTQ